MCISTRLRATRRRALVAAGLGGLAVLAASCAIAGSDAAPRIGAGQGGRLAAPDRAAEVYAQVVRELVLRDPVARRTPYRVVYVVDGAVPGAADPLNPRPRRPGVAFATTIKAEIRRAVRDGPPVVFARRPAQVIDGTTGAVVRGGVLVTLGPIRWRGDRRALVPSGRWAVGKDGQWATYVVARRGSGWRVTGFAGPITIS